MVSLVVLFNSYYTKIVYAIIATTVPASHVTYQSKRENEILSLNGASIKN